MRAVFGCAALLGFFVVMLGCDDQGSSTLGPRLEVGKEGRIVSGGRSLSGGKSSAVAVESKANFDDVHAKIAEALRVHDTIGAFNAMAQGNGFFVDPDTRVLVIEVSGPLARVRVLEGPTFGRDGWVLGKLVTQ